MEEIGDKDRDKNRDRDRDRDRETKYNLFSVLKNKIEAGGLKGENRVNPNRVASFPPSFFPEIPPVVNKPQSTIKKPNLDK